MVNINHLMFKKSLVIFWFLWWAIAFWTDIVGGMAHFGYLSASWAPDTNYPFLQSSLAMYNVPEWLILASFLAIVIWSGVSTVLFGYASLKLSSKKWLDTANVAYIVSLLYWCAFFLAD